MIQYKQPTKKNSSQPKEQHVYLIIQTDILSTLGLIFEIFKNHKPSEGYRSQLIHDQMNKILTSEFDRTSANYRDPVIMLQGLEGWLDPENIEDGWLMKSQHPVIKQLKIFKEDFYKSYHSIENIKKYKNDYLTNSHPEEKEEEKKIEIISNGEIKKDNNAQDNVLKTLQEQMLGFENDKKQMIEIQQQNNLQFESLKQKTESLEKKTKTLEDENKKLNLKYEEASEAKEIFAKFLLQFKEQAQEQFLLLYKQYQSQGSTKELEYLDNIFLLDNKPANGEHAVTNTHASQQIISINRNNVNTNHSDNSYGKQLPSSSALISQSIFSINPSNGVTKEAEDFAKAVCTYFDNNGNPINNAFFITRYNLILEFKTLCENDKDKETRDQARLAIRLLLLEKYSMPIQKVKKEMGLKISQLQETILKIFGEKDDSKELSEVSINACRSQLKVEEGQAFRKAYTSNYLSTDDYGSTIFSKLWRHIEDSSKNQFNYTQEDYFTNYTTTTIEHQL